jgi:hypothetical protein
VRTFGAPYWVFAYNRRTGQYDAVDVSTSYACACAIAERLRQERGLAYVEKPDGLRWYPEPEEEE